MAIVFRVFVSSLLLLISACRVSLSPLQNKIAVGQEAFAVFVAEGEGATGDLYAVSAAGGATTPITYTRVRELAPSLSPQGTALAFIREATPGNPGTRRVVVMNLLNGAERMPPATDLPPEAVAWSPDGVEVFVHAGDSLYATPAPPAAWAWRSLGGAERVRADSAFMVLLGTPSFARAIECPEVGVCVELPGGERSVLDAEAKGVVRWGSDSVGYFVGTSFVVRPLGPGRARALRLTPPRLEPRELTFFPGPPAVAPQ